MLSLKSRSFLFKIPSIFNLRFRGLLEHFCKSDDGDKECNHSVSVQLESPYELYNLDSEPKSSVCLDRKLALKLYTEMETIRIMERALADLYLSKVVRGFCHLYVGQEACCVGIKSAMRPQDTVITSYRSHGWTWLMGVPIHNIIAELCQKQSGCSRGKGGSMHTYGANFYGGNGIVGAQVPLGVGQAFFHAYTCNNGVSFSCYGDGAANQGQIFEVFNMSCLWKLPVVYVCENNKFSMGTSVKRSTCGTDYYTRGDFIPGLRVSGNDVLAVRSATEFVINHATTCGPIILELETYRYFGHSLSDPGTSYRTREEVQMMREKSDPIKLFKQLCVKEELITEDEFKKIEGDIKKEVSETVKEVLKEKEPDPSELAADVYALNLEGKIRNIAKYNLMHKNIGERLVNPGPLRPTPKSEIKELPKVDKKKPAESSGGDKKEEKKVEKPATKAPEVKPPPKK